MAVNENFTAVQIIVTAVKVFLEHGHGNIVTGVAGLVTGVTTALARIQIT